MIGKVQKKRNQEKINTINRENNSWNHYEKIEKII